jgi:uncharacterized protein YceK
MRILLITLLLLSGCATTKNAAGPSVSFRGVERKYNNLYVCMYPETFEQLVCLDYLTFQNSLKESE